MPESGDELTDRVPHWRPYRPKARRFLTVGVLGLLLAEIVSRLLVPLFMTLHISRVTGEVAGVSQHAKLYSEYVADFAAVPIPYLFLFPKAVAHVREFGTGFEGIAPAFWHLHAWGIATTAVYPAVVAVVSIGYLVWRYRHR